MLEGVKSTSIRDVARRAAGDETDEDEERVSETASERSSVLFSLWEDKETRKTRRKSEEINSYYAGRFGFGKYYLEFPPKVLCNVRRQNRIRRLCIHLVRQTWFDVVILCLIVVNAFLMAFYDPVDERLGIESTANSVIQNSEWGFQTVFTIEAIIKIVALGLFPYPSGYLREGWNILDFCIVVAGWVPLLVGGTSMGENSVDGSTTSSLTILRFARILRPLRALRIFPSLNKLVRAILNAASQVAEVLVLCSAILFVFALVGLTLFKGNLRQRCALLEPTLNEWIIPVSELESFCSMEPHLYGRTCPAGLTCIYAGFNPDNELVSFDNFYLSLLTVFQVITLEGWSTVMFGLFDTVNKVHGLFFIFLVLFGAYFMTNLLVSALSVNYMLVRRQAEQEEALRAGSAPLIDELVKQEEQKGNSLRGFQSLSLEKQVQLMEMRLMFEYEKHCHQPTYTVVSKTMYETYRSRVNQAAYARWRKRFRSTQAKRIRDQANLALAQVKHKREVFSKERPESTEFMDAESSLHKILGNTSFATVADVKQQPARRRGASGDSELSASSHFFDANGVEEDASLFSARARALGQGQDQDQDADSNNAALETAPRESRASSVASHSTKSNIIGEAHALIKLNRERSMKEQRDRSSSKAPIGATMRGSPVQRFVYQRITSTRWFTVLVFCLILLNTIFLALEHFEQPASWFVMLNVVNIVLLALFAVEMILRMVAEGLRFYFQSGFNILDFVIVVGGFVQLFLGDQVLSVLRALRFLRFLRLANHWTTLNHLLESIQITIVHVSPFLVFLAIVMYILTISGLQFFGGSFTIPQTIESSEFVFANDGSPVNGTLNINAEFDCTPYAGKFLRQLKNGTDVLVCPTRTNYDNFLWSFVATFQVISGDDWNSVMVQATEQTESYWPVVYYVFVVLFGSFLVLNFFLAILLDTFVRLYAEHRKKNKRQPEIPATPSSQSEKSHSSSQEENQDKHEASKIESGASFEFLGEKSNSTNQQELESATVQPVDLEAGVKDHHQQHHEERPSLLHSNSRTSKSLEVRRQQSRRDASLQDILARKARKIYDLSEDEVDQLEGLKHSSLYVIPPHHQLRKKLGVVVSSSWFDMLIILVILWSCVVLALDSPVHSVVSQDTLFLMNVIIAGIFTLEALCKIFVFGFVLHRGAYLTNRWSVLDFVIVVVSVVDVVLTSTGYSSTHGLIVLRSLRALRPLRAIQKFEGLRIVVASFAKALLPCFQLLALSLVFYAMFSIVFTSSYLGELHACYECDVLTNECVRHFNDPSSPTCMPYELYDVACPVESRCEGPASNSSEWRWLNPSYGSTVEKNALVGSYSFDNFLESYLTLFEISSVEIWLEPMAFVSDAVGIGKEPVRGSNDGRAIVFVVFLFTMQYFVLQIFVAVLINTYLDSSSEETGDAFMTSGQRQWVEFNRRAMMRGYKGHPRFQKPPGRLRGVIFDLVTAPQFKTFIYGVIILNSLWLTTEHYNQSSTFTVVFQVFETTFGAIYLLEAILKIVAFGPRGYFSVKTNWFDFVIVAAVVINWVLWALEDAEEVEALRALEALRVLRVLRLLKLIPALKALLGTLLLTLFPLLNISGLILIVFFIYAILGMAAFGGLVTDYDEAHFNFLSPHVNFDTFPNAFFTLFTMSTGESWNGLSRELSTLAPLAGFYCNSFIIIVMVIMMNLFVAVILTNYTTQFEQNRRPNGVKKHLDENSLRDYNNVWNELYAKYVSDLEDLVAEKREAQRLVPSSENVAALYRANKALHIALDSPLFLPVDLFPDLVLQLKAPLGFRKRTPNAKVRFTTAHVMKLVQQRPIPVKNDRINYYSTLRALVEINVLEGDIPTEVQTLLTHKLGSGMREKLDPLQDTERSNSVVHLIAEERLKEVIRGHIIRWRIRRMRRHGASDETIRKFLEEYAIRKVQLEFEKSFAIQQMRENQPARKPGEEEEDDNDDTDHRINVVQLL